MSINESLQKQKGNQQSTLPCSKKIKGQETVTPDDKMPAVALLSRRQVAQRWACCEHSVMRRKDLKPLRFNRRFLRYRLSDVKAIEAAAIAYEEGR